jgi:hypothetical protein
MGGQFSIGVFEHAMNQDVKTNGLGKSRPTNRTELMAIVRS